MYDEYGFFRNLYLWSTTTTMAPADLWQVVDIIQRVQWLTELEAPGQKMIEHSVPHVLAFYFSKPVLQDADTSLSGLSNLRQVSRGASRVGIPQRTSYPLEG
jgi:hypothetical protein